MEPPVGPPQFSSIVNSGSCWYSNNLLNYSGGLSTSWGHTPWSGVVRWCQLLDWGSLRALFICSRHVVAVEKQHINCSVGGCFHILIAVSVWVGAQSGLGPCPGWGPVRVGAHMGPYGPLWDLMGPILLNKSLALIKDHKIINKNIEVVKLEILKVKTWFVDKGLFS